MWHYVLRRTAHLFLNQHCEFITNISERCALSRRQSGPIHCPSAKDGGVGGVPLARRQNMTTIRRATGWPYRRIRLSGALDGPQQKTRLLLLHLQRSGAWPAGPVSSLKADEIHLNFTGVSFLENSFNINKELPILSRSPWPLVVADRAAKGSSLQPRGLGGDKNVRLTTQLRSTTWGEPDTNMTTPAAQHGLAYKQPASQQVRYRANSCTAGSMPLSCFHNGPIGLHSTIDAFFNTNLIIRASPSLVTLSVVLWV